MKFLIINGPNLNLMHFTEPGVAGQIDYNTLLDYIEAGCAQMDIQTEFFQSNHEGDLIDEIQSAAGRADGIVINPGGYAYYSVAILEALQICGVPAAEVMLSDPADGSRSGALTWSPSAVRAALPGRVSAAISMPAHTWCSCSGWTAAHRHIWFNKKGNKK